MSIVGFTAECKYAQNNDANINISLSTNNWNPKFKLFFTASVWSPKYVLSAIISLNHSVILYSIAIILNNIGM